MSATTPVRSALGDTVSFGSGAWRLRGMCFLERYTTADSGATETRSFLSPPVRSRWSPLPQTFSHLLFGTNVGTEAVDACSALLSATTYSCLRERSMRENAYTPAEDEA